MVECLESLGKQCPISCGKSPALPNNIAVEIEVIVWIEWIEKVWGERMLDIG